MSITGCLVLTFELCIDEFQRFKSSVDIKYHKSVLIFNGLALNFLSETDNFQMDTFGLNDFASTEKLKQYKLTTEFLVSSIFVTESFIST